MPSEDHHGLLALLGILLEAGADPLAPMLPGNDMTPLPFALLMVATHLLEDVPAVAVEMVRWVRAWQVLRAAWQGGPWWGGSVCCGGCPTQTGCRCMAAQLVQPLL